MQIIKSMLLIAFFSFSFPYFSKSEDECSFCPTFSHSALLGKPASQNVILELGMTNYFRYHAPSSNQCARFFLDIFPFFFVSTNNEQLAEYFLPHGNSSITIANNNTSDISSPWLHINTPGFSSKLCISPRRSEFGFAANFFTYFGNWIETNSEILHRSWLTLFIPFEWVRHNLHAKEDVFSNQTCGLSAGAFDSSAWCFGKISCDAHSKVGIADILIRLGYDFISCPESHFAFYASAIIPTFHGTESHFLFEPTLGNLGHFGLGAGLNSDLNIYQTETTHIQWMLDLRYFYFFGRKEVRSTDLFFNDDWSRYLLVATLPHLETPLPGINSFTQSVSVKPRNSVNLWTAFHIARCLHHFELGYNLWWRQEELVGDFCSPEVVIYDIQGTPGARTSASQATIQTGAAGVGAPHSDAFPILVTANDLSTLTPAIPHILTNSFYASYARNFVWCSREALLSAGAYYDVSWHKAGFSGIGGWLKASIAF